MVKKTDTDLMKPEPVEKQAQPERVTVQMIDPAIAKRQADNLRIGELNREFKTRLMREPKVPFAPSEFYADVLGRVWHFSLNGYDVVVRFDGTVQKFPKTIYKFLVKKLDKILVGQTHRTKMDEL